MSEAHPSQLDGSPSFLLERRSYHLLQGSATRYDFLLPCISSLSFYANVKPEFTEHQRNVFCVFSGEGVNRLRIYLNESPESLYETEGTMYDDREVEDMDTDQRLPGLMHATGLNDDDDDMDEVDGADGSQYELEGEG